MSVLLLLKPVWQATAVKYTTLELPDIELVDLWNTGAVGCIIFIF